MNEEIYKGVERAGSRTYFFDVKKATTKKLYLDITETRKQKDDSYEWYLIEKESGRILKTLFLNC